MTWRIIWFVLGLIELGAIVFAIMHRDTFSMTKIIVWISSIVVFIVLTKVFGAAFKKKFTSAPPERFIGAKAKTLQPIGKTGEISCTLEDGSHILKACRSIEQSASIPEETAVYIVDIQDGVAHVLSEAEFKDVYTEAYGIPKIPGHTN